MPSYKKHILFSLVIALPFFPDVFYLALAVIGASIIDLDHHVKKKNLMLMAFFGILIALIFYVFNLPYTLGIILIVLALIFQVSKHRGFMHSFFGTTLITLFLTLFIMGSYLLLLGFPLNLKVILIAVTLFLGLMILNKNLIIPYSVLVTIGIIFSPNLVLNPYYIFLALFLGCLSHIVLDLFSTTGVRLFNPLFNRKFRKMSGIALIILWGLVVVLSFFAGRIPLYGFL